MAAGAARPKPSNHFATLGVAEPSLDSQGQLLWDVSDADLKRAYTKKSLQYHPDRNAGEDAAAKFKEVTLAFRTLSDPGSRQAYLREFSQRLKVDLSWRPAEADVDIETRVKAEAERRARMEAQRKLDAVKFRSQVLSEVRERLSLAQKLKRDETYRKELREKLLDQGGEETAGAGDSSYRKRAARPLDPRTARAAKHARFVDKARRTVDAQSDSEASKPRKASSPQPESASSAEGSRREKASDLENGQEAAK